MAGLRARQRQLRRLRSENGNGCVEIAFLSGGGVALRDTKDRSLPAHRFTTAEWTAFTAGVRAGEFDRP